MLLYILKNSQQFCSTSSCGSPDVFVRSESGLLSLLLLSIEDSQLLLSVGPRDIIILSITPDNAGPDGSAV